MLSDLAPIPTSSLTATTFGSLITPLISLFKSTLSSLNTSIKRNLQKYTFLALSTYTSLSESETHWEDLMCRRAGRRENELKDALTSLRSVCLRSFPELIANIKAGAMGKGGELSTNVADFTTSVSPLVFVLTFGVFPYSLIDCGVPRACARGEDRRGVGVAETRRRELENG